MLQDHHDVVKIQLSLPALERLIGGNSELEVQLRHQVVANFAKHRLKELINDTTWRKIYTEWSTEIERLVMEKLNEYLDKTEQDGKSKAERATLDHCPPLRRLQELVARNVDGAVENATSQAIDRYITSRVEHYKEYIDRSVKMRLDQNIRVLVKEEVEKRIKAALEQP